MEFEPIINALRVQVNTLLGNYDQFTSVNFGVSENTHNLKTNVAGRIAKLGN